MANANAVMGSTRDRFHGCLLAGAVGDALGAPVEFMSRGEILRRLRPRRHHHCTRRPSAGQAGSPTTPR
jgi:ADP-ribosylglycohydrolase